MPNKNEFNNFPQILYTSHAVYSAYEGNCRDYIRFEIVTTHDLIRLYTRALGLPRSSDEAQRMLLYFFYGKFFWYTKKKRKKGEQGPAKTVFREKTMVFYLHKKLINGRSKFAKRMEIYFAKFIAAYRSHASEWEPFLTDGGKGSPPLEYNILLEDGVRCCCADIFLMGTKALRSKSYWGQVVHPANKLESWVAVGRHVNHTKSGTMLGSRTTPSAENLHVRSALEIYHCLTVMTKRTSTANTNLIGKNTRSNPISQALSRWLLHKKRLSRRNLLPRP